MNRAALAVARWIRVVRALATVPLLVLFAGCDEPALHRLLEARELSGDMLVKFAEAVSAGNQAVMADSDERSLAFAGRAEQATDAVQKAAEALSVLLGGLRLEEEEALLAQFEEKFGRYRALDETILGLAVENTNDEAQDLAFGAGQQAADALRDALAPIAPREGTAPGDWQTKALAASALASAREIQVLEAPHIAAVEDGDMTGFEQRMAAAETATRDALATLTGVVRPAVQPQVAAAVAAFARLMEINAQVVDLSRRNTDVRSLALSFNEKGALTADCERALEALHDALAQRVLSGSR